MTPTGNPHDPTDPWARALRTAMSPARQLEPTDHEVHQALAAGARSRRPTARLLPRLATFALCALVLGGTLYAVPVTRATVDDAYGTLSEWVSGTGNDAPGRSIPADAPVPDWIRTLPGQKRLIAGKQGANLFVVRNGDQLEIAIGNGVGMGTTIDDWRERFAGDSIVPLGPGGFPGPTDSPDDDQQLDSRKRRALMGLTAKDVDRIVLTYTTGRPTTERDLNGGYVLLADATRRPRTLTAYTVDGRILERRDATNVDLRVCRDERGCPPGTYDPPITYDPPADPTADVLPEISRPRR